MGIFSALSYRNEKIDRTHYTRAEKYLKRKSRPLLRTLLSRMCDEMMLRQVVVPTHCVRKRSVVSSPSLGHSEQPQLCYSQTRPKWQRRRTSEEASKSTCLCTLRRWSVSQSARPSRVVEPTLARDESKQRRPESTHEPEESQVRCRDPPGELALEEGLLEIGE